jgi:catechol 2,3-dioxygenase-like lactoylglutathione lyase family enzyme
MLEFDHIALSVPSISEAVSFYQHSFTQTSILYHDVTWALLQVDSLKIAFVLEEEHPPHLAFGVDTEAELNQLAEEAKAKISLHRDGSKSFYKKDPGGNVLEVIYYP